VARIRPDGTFELALAGHLPPVLARPGMPAVLLGTPRPPVGAGIGRRRRTPTFAMTAGSTLLLYTDGLVERRNELIDVGLERLRSAVRASSPDEVCRAVMARFVPRDRSDDVCVLAVQLKGTIEP
jgi:phosphoserine phosphatase RsbU/P